MKKEVSIAVISGKLFTNKKPYLLLTAEEALVLSNYIANNVTDRVVKVTKPGDEFGLEGVIDRPYEGGWLVYLEGNSGEGQLFLDSEIEITERRVGGA